MDAAKAAHAPHGINFLHHPGHMFSSHILSPADKQIPELGVVAEAAGVRASPSACKSFHAHALHEIILVVNIPIRRGQSVQVLYQRPHFVARYNAFLLHHQILNIFQSTALLKALHNLKHGKLGLTLNHDIDLWMLDYLWEKQRKCAAEHNGGR